MLLPTSKTYETTDFALSTGAHLPKLTVAYETWGELAADGNNAILLCHGYTNHPHAAGEGGWFAPFIGPGKAIDTDKYFVVCSNMLGSAYGTSGPASINPETGRPYGPDFPKYTTTDMVAAQKLLVDHLGIGQMKAVIGYSYGGHLTFLWGAMHPDRMRALVPVAGVITRKTSVEEVAKIRARFEDLPGWNGGHYYGREKESGVFDRLVEMRRERLQMYGVGQHLADTLGDPKEVDRALTERATQWAGEFDANSLSILYEAGIGSSAEAIAGNIKAPLLDVLATTDSVVDVALGPVTVEMLTAKGVDARFLAIDTPYGHAGPIADWQKWAGELAAFLEGTP